MILALSSTKTAITSNCKMTVGFELCALKRAPGQDPITKIIGRYT